MTIPVTYDAVQVGGALTWVEVVDALERVLLGGLDPEADPDRSRVAAASGDLLLMPSSSMRRVGAKLITVRTAPDLTGRLPTVRGVYVLFDGESLAPLAILDGAALTALRTPAVSALAVRHLCERPLSRLVVFGSGVQAEAHARALQATAGVERVDLVARNPATAGLMAGRLRDAGLAVTLAGPDAVAGADAVVCASSAGVPLFDGALLREDAVVVAIGSATLDDRELDSDLVVRSTVVVESRRSARAEAGAVVMPAAENRLELDAVPTLADLVRGRVAIGGRPSVFVGTGMSWQDLAVADAVVERLGRSVESTSA